MLKKKQQYGKLAKEISRFFCLGFIVVSLPMLLACSSDGKPLKIKNSIYTDAIKVRVKGIENDAVSDNVEAYLSSLPVISKARAKLYGREISDKITLAVHSFGYYHPEIEIQYPNEKTKDHNLVAKVDLGKPLFIRNAQIEIIGEGAYYQSFKDIISKSGISSYKLLNHGSYQKLKDDLQAKTLELGFFDAKLVSARILVYQEQNAADIVLIYDTGKRYQFGSVLADAKSKKLLKPSTSLVNFHEGMNFSSKTVSAFSASLSQTNFYRSVDVRPLVEQRKDGKVPVSVELERQSKNLFRLGLGLSTDEGVRGLAGWDKPLINDKGHSFSSYVRASQVKKEAQGIYKIPHKNPNLDYFYIRLSQSRIDLNDNLSDVSHASFHYVANMTGVWRRDYYVAAEYENYTQGFEKAKPFNLMLGLQLSRRSTSGGLDPKTGYSIVWDNRLGSRALSDANFWHTEFTLKGIVSPSVNTRVLYKLIQGANIGSDSFKVPPSMRFFAGGERTLRGFSYKSASSRDAFGKLTGSRYLTSATTEFMFPIGFKNSRGAVFLDAAVCTNDYKNRHLLLGPGIGYRYQSAFGLIKVDLAYGMDRHSKNNQFKLHLLFGPEF